jgi:uncharacterized protein
MQTKLNSIAENERIVSVDVMRGFAILGIYLVNMMAFHSPFLYIDPIKWWDHATDQTAYATIDILAQASFYPLFSMLFGYGLVILRERAIVKGVNFHLIAVRRLGMLLLIGMIHAFLIWEGDILILYAVFGFLSLFFLHLSGKKLLLSGILLYLIPNLLLFLLYIVMFIYMPQQGFDISNPAAAEASIQAYQNGTFSEITKQRIHDWSSTNNIGSFPIFLVSIFPLLLIGAGVAKLGWIENPKIHQEKLKKILLFTIPIGLILKLMPYLMGRNYANDYLQDFFGGVLMAITYACLISLLMNKFPGGKLLLFLAPIGKLSMSNYLFQSLVSTWIFYNYGLGFYGEISLTAGVVLALGIFSIQVLLSHFWVKRFYYGPVEWLWRSATYLNLPKWKR